jgi:hypothetical protein
MQDELHFFANQLVPSRVLDRVTHAHPAGSAAILLSKID